MAPTFFGLFRDPRARTADAAHAPPGTPPGTPPSPAHGVKRRTEPPPSGRTAAVVKARWTGLDKENARAAKATPAKKKRSYTNWFTPFRRGKKAADSSSSSASNPLAIRLTSPDGETEEADIDVSFADGSFADSFADSFVDRSTTDMRLTTPPQPERRTVQLIPTTEGIYEHRPEEDDDDDEEDDEGVDWFELFEAEPDTDAPSAEGEWEVDADELAAYEAGVWHVEGFGEWTSDERRLHRLLSLRGFHPLMPATWARDFLGVPLYPSLFAPPDADKPTLIYNKGSQFRATKALRNLFDLQVRVSGLRQSGNTGRIDGIIERELRRYIGWAAEDVGLDQCAPLAAMPNIAAKRFAKSDRPGSGSLGQRIEAYFRSWTARYRRYYAGLPPFPERRLGEEGIKEEDDSGKETLRRLRPPRILYCFIIVQHVVMLLAVDAARPRMRPRCFVDFNMSLGGHWLDASLNVAIPVHMARAAQLRCIRGLALPAPPEPATDVDA